MEEKGRPDSLNFKWIYILLSFKQMSFVPDITWLNVSPFHKIYNVTVIQKPALQASLIEKNGYHW